MDLASRVGSNIKRLRLEKDISRKDFAESIGVDASRLLRIEEGANLTLSMIKKIADQLEVDPYVLLLNPDSRAGKLEVVTELLGKTNSILASLK